MNTKHKYELNAVYGVKRLDGFERIDGKTVALVTCVLCGKQSRVRPNSLFRSKQTSCRCLVAKVGGDSNGRLYAIYHNMKYRCCTETAHEYSNYGGRGIKVCDEWMGANGYQTFKSWALSNGYTNSLTLDRIDSDRGYSPDNCQWITKSENTARGNASKRTQHRKADRGMYYAQNSDGRYIEFYNAREFADEHSLSASAVRDRARNGGQMQGWVFGYTADLHTTEPQSTIESPVSRNE